MTKLVDWVPDSQRMLVFAQRWVPFGGGSADDIFTEFGVTERVFFLRLRHLTRSLAPSAIDDVTRRSLERICSARLDTGAVRARTM
ncbi:hypothetical protein [Gordonia soli]|uniref:DUF3263 domain-containing protein n=1 Tax=Gordonia soli NBRC 108243 TaxID=1223545 RepID=M0QME6_9ACTN|nr:hypothetical protein [Gordonia soli]GAC69451.1 hypothetical protein GS4_25_00210 [Gordonia soli NBRC 108243]